MRYQELAGFPLYYLKPGENLTLEELTLLLGNFDGVHRGHQRLLLEAKDKGTKNVMPLLFSLDPGLVFHKHQGFLTSLEDRLRLFRSYGADGAIILEVDASFYDLNASTFAEDVIKALNPKLLVVGSDYSFGKGKKGNPQTLREDFNVLEVPLLENHRQKISTSSIIAALQKRDFQEVKEELGRLYEIKGTVVKGFQNGRKIGFPTANLSLYFPYVLPPTGVYNGLVYVRGKPYKSIINIGNNPTIGLLKENRLEAYLENFSGDIYGSLLYLDFMTFLREEKKFASLAELRETLENDVKSLRELKL